MAPELAAGPGVDRPTGVEGARDVNDAVQHERCGLEFAQRVGLEGPLRREAVHVLRRDLRERTVALIAAAAAATRTIAGTIRKPIESARYAKAMAAAKKVTADATAASAPIRAIRDSLLDRSRRAYHPIPPTMFIGHFGLAFGAKRIAPTVSLGLLFAACQLADLLWPTLLLLGIERVIIEPGNTVVTPLDFVSYPYSHSLLTLGILGMSLGGAYMGLRRAPAPRCSSSSSAIGCWTC